MLYFAPWKKVLIWGLCALYFAIGLWLYITTTSQGSGSPAQTMFVWFDRVIRRIKDAALRLLGRTEGDAAP